MEITIALSGSYISRNDAYELWIDEVKSGAEGIVRSYHQFSEFEQDDLLAEIRERFVDKLHTLEDPEKLRAWSYTLARNSCNTAYQKKLRLQQTTLSLSEEYPDESPVTFTELYLQRSKERVLEKVVEEIGNLKPKEREAVWQSFFEGKSNKEIADALGVVPSAISHCIIGAKRHLRSLLKRRALRDVEFARDWEDVYGDELPLMEHIPEARGGDGESKNAISYKLDFPKV